MAAGGHHAALQPTYQGHVDSTQDALVLFEACLQGHLSHVPRRPHDRERSTLIQSGKVFIYEENASGIKRWTDGVTWSPSRILGNFLIYRELDKPFPPGEKKRAMKKQNRRPTRAEPYSTSRQDQNGESYSPNSTSGQSLGQDRMPSEPERALVGSLIDSYGFKDNGLVKKTMSVTVGGVTHHLVSYYNCDDVLQKRLQRPTQDQNLQGCQPRHELVHKQSFRVAVDDTDDLVDPNNPASSYMYSHSIVPTPGYLANGPQSYYPYNSVPPNLGPNHPYQIRVPPAPQAYMQGAAPNTQFARSEEYGNYGQNTYRPHYGGIGSHNPMSSIPPNMPPNLQTSLPIPQPDRTPNQSLVYGQQPNVQPRSNMAQSPVAMDRNGNSYAMDPASQASNVQPPRPHQTPHVQMPDRRESQMAYGVERQPQFYADNGPALRGDGGSMAGTDYSRAPYQPNTPMQDWPHTL
ncbi:MAG: hypothetical protein Q9227_002989 [Pyrenula ochraceoflavens]